MYHTLCREQLAECDDRRNQSKEEIIIEEVQIEYIGEILMKIKLAKNIVIDFVKAKYA